jgi:hypothetical protein
MSYTTRVATLLLIAVSGCTAVVQMSLWRSATPTPTSETLVRGFADVRPALDSLRVMSDADPRVIGVGIDHTRIDSNWAWPRPDSLLGFSRERWAQYRSILHGIDAACGLERTEDALVFVVMGCEGMLDSFHESGYAYLPAGPPPDTVAHVAREYIPLGDRWYAFRHQSR